MKAYLSGPMSGLPDLNKPAFYRAAAEMRCRAIDVVNPAEHEADAKGQSWSDYLKKDLVLLAQCDMVAVLPGWTKSRGARLEVYVALKLGMKVIDAATLEDIPLKVVDPVFRSVLGRPL